MYLMSCSYFSGNKDMQIKTNKKGKEKDVSWNLLPQGTGITPGLGGQRVSSRVSPGGAAKGLHDLCLGSHRPEGTEPQMGTACQGHTASGLALVSRL